MGPRRKEKVKVGTGAGAGVEDVVDEEKGAAKNDTGKNRQKGTVGAEVGPKIEKYLCATGENCFGAIIFGVCVIFYFWHVSDSLLAKYFWCLNLEQ